MNTHTIVEGPPSSSFSIHGHHHVYPRSRTSDDDLKISFAATSHNSWFHHLQPTTCRSHARII